MTIDEACERYWQGVERHGRAYRDEAKNLEIVSRFIGLETLLVGITPEIIACCSSPSCYADRAIAARRWRTDDGADEAVSETIDGQSTAY